MGHLPFGTGNDFARSFGWGGHAPSKLIGTKKEPTKYLRDHVPNYLNCETREHDIWAIEIQTHEGGSFSFVKESGEDCLP